MYISSSSTQDTKAVDMLSSYMISPNIWLLSSTSQTKYLKSSKDLNHKEPTRNLNTIHLKAHKCLAPLKETSKRKYLVKISLSNHRTHENHQTLRSSMNYTDGLLISNWYESIETESNRSVAGNF